MYLLCTQIRGLHMSASRLLRNRRNNPGIAYQAKEDLLNLEEVEQDDMGSLDANFTELHKTHRQHEKELLQEREQVRRHIVKHKYFREPHLPNLLTYAEKDQMRLLHTRDPEEWTVERLAECFPTTPDIVKKILAAKWRPRSAKRIKKHDEIVLSNWEKLRDGSNELQLTPVFRAHLSKFANRRPEDLFAVNADEWPTRTQVPRPESKEFLSIITSCSKYADQTTNNSPNPTPMITSSNVVDNSDKNNSVDPELETYLLEKVKDKRKMRLQELKKLKLTPEELASSSTMSVKSVDTLEHRTATTLTNPSGTGILPSLNMYAKKFESTEIAITAEDQQRFEMTRTKDRIHIPRKLWRKGATYRIEDCYYDDDGELLYRVPGMTGSNTSTI